MQRITLFPGLVAVALFAAQGGRAQPPAPTDEAEREGLVTYYDQFEGEARLLSGETVHVDLRTWIVRGGVELEQLPMDIDGAMIVHLRNGELETTVEGEQRQRREDDFWSVPSGVSMALETDEDAAVFDTIVIRER